MISQQATQAEPCKLCKMQAVQAVQAANRILSAKVLIGYSFLIKPSELRFLVTKKKN